MTETVREHDRAVSQKQTAAFMSNLIMLKSLLIIELYVKFILTHFYEQQF